MSTPYAQVSFGPTGPFLHSCAVAGYVITDINREFFSRPIAKKIISRIPQQRVGEVEDLDAAMLMLAGDGSQWMTGSDTGDGRDF